MSERAIQERIRRALVARGYWVFKVHGNAYQQAGVPDLLCVKGGRLLAVEVKQPGKEPSAIQIAVIQQLRDHGAVAGVAASVEEAIELAEESEK